MQADLKGIQWDGLCQSDWHLSCLVLYKSYKLKTVFHYEIISRVREVFKEAC